MPQSRTIWTLAVIGVVLLAVAVAVIRFGASRWNDLKLSERRSTNLASVTRCIFTGGWVEASGTVVRGKGTAPQVVVNLLVDGIYVDRDVVYDPPIGKTAFWTISEPNVRRGACAVTTG